MADPYSEIFGRGPGKLGYTPMGYDIDPSAFQYGQYGDPLYETLMTGMRGQGGTVAEEQMKRSLGRAGKGAVALSAGRGGMGAGTAMRLAGQQAGEAGRGMQMALPALRAQEQMAAEQQMQNYLGQQMQAQMAEQQLRAQQQQYIEQMMMQQSIANAMGSGQQGLLGSLTQAGGQIAGLALGGGF